MYLLHHETFVKNILPVHWRETWRKRVAVVLLAPLFSLINAFFHYQGNLPGELNLNSQVIVLENYLNVRFSNGRKEIFINEPLDATYDLGIGIPKDKEDNEIRSALDQYLIAGKIYKIETY